MTDEMVSMLSATEKRIRVDLKKSKEQKVETDPAVNKTNFKKVIDLSVIALKYDIPQNKISNFVVEILEMFKS